MATHKEIPISYQLSQNFPNPFNPRTWIQYALPEPSYVVLTVYDITGKEVKNLVNSYQTTGYKSIVWSGKNDRDIDVPSGLYIYRIQVRSAKSSKSFQQVRKMIILR